MTGFGRATRDGRRYRFEVTVRSVNHRFLDCVLRLRDPLRDSEPALRQLLGSHLDRGHVELTIELRPLISELQSRATIDEGLAARLLVDLRGLVSRLELTDSVTLDQLLRVPGVVTVEVGATAWTEDDADDLLRVVGEALELLVAQREREGAQTLRGLENLLVGFEQLLVELENGQDAMRRGILTRAQDRLSELLVDREIDDSRMIQEAAHLAERSDVREELERLRGHLEHFRAALVEDCPVGRRLDFLAQELYRESNTLATKSRDVAWSLRAVEAKLLSEQLREQVQNIE
jgi:uncharacterized protein (TIGR00255 family)